MDDTTYPKTHLPHHFPTHSGGRVDLSNPDPADIDVRDVCQGLAHTARYNGQHGPYSVGQHSCLVHDFVAGKLDKAGIGGQVELRLAALLHDGPEAYIGDVIQPLKRLLAPLYGPLEVLWETAFAVRFQFAVEYFNDPLVKLGDRTVYNYERRDVAVYPGKVWDLSPEIVLPLEKIRVWTPERTMDEFMQRFEAYR